MNDEISTKPSTKFTGTSGAEMTFRGVQTEVRGVGLYTLYVNQSLDQECPMIKQLWVRWQLSVKKEILEEG